MNHDAQMLSLPDGAPQSAGLAVEVIHYGILCYGAHGVELLLLVTSDGYASISPTKANKEYLATLGISIYSAAPPPKPSADSSFKI